MTKQKQAQINERYKGHGYGALVQFPKRVDLISSGSREDYGTRMKIVGGAKILQEYDEINDLGAELLMFACTHINRGTNFGDLSKLLF